MMVDRIKLLREDAKMTQTELAHKLGVTRSGVNAWEMGISTPSTQSIVELAHIFHVSTDYLLGFESTASADLSGLTDDDMLVVHHLIRHLRSKNILNNR